MSKKLYVDGCCNKTIGSCVSVVDEDGDLIGPYENFLSYFKFLDPFSKKQHRDRTVYEVSFTDTAQQQNNGCELVAMCIGLLIAIYYKYDIVYSDSTLIIDHWSKKESETIQDPYKAKIQRYCIELRRIYENKGGEIKHISGKLNPADLGFHRK